jgi:hypothetical protein
MIALDLVYARTVPTGTAAASDVSDLLLLVSAVTTLTGVVALASTGARSGAGAALLASLALATLGLFGPALLAPFVEPGSVGGPVLRLLQVGLISALALAAFAIARRATPSRSM